MKSRTLKPLITVTAKLWRKFHLTYDQARYVTKEVRRTLGVKRIKVRKRVIQRLSRDEEQRGSFKGPIGTKASGAS